MLLDQFGDPRESLPGIRAQRIEFFQDPMIEKLYFSSQAIPSIYQKRDTPRWLLGAPRIVMAQQGFLRWREHGGFEHGVERSRAHATPPSQAEHRFAVPLHPTIAASSLPATSSARALMASLLRRTRSGERSELDALDVGSAQFAPVTAVQTRRAGIP